MYTTTFTEIEIHLAARNDHCHLLHTSHSIQMYGSPIWELLWRRRFNLPLVLIRRHEEQIIIRLSKSGTQPTNSWHGGLSAPDRKSSKRWSILHPQPWMELLEYLLNQHPSHIYSPQHLTRVAGEQASTSNNSTWGGGCDSNKVVMILVIKAVHFALDTTTTIGAGRMLWWAMIFVFDLSCPFFQH